MLTQQHEGWRQPLIGRGLEHHVAQNHRVGFQTLWMSMGKEPYKPLWVSLVQFASDLWSWSGQTGDYFMGYQQM